MRARLRIRLPAVARPLATALLAWAGLFASSVQAGTCPPMPASPAWHDSDAAKQFVAQYHHGDWVPYIAKWRREIGNLLRLHSMGLGAHIQGTDVTFHGESLLELTERLRQRVEVLECLAAESGARVTESQGKAPREMLPTRAGDANMGATQAKTLKCIACHDRDGHSDNPAIPDLAGQKERYLIDQLMLFRSAATGKSETGLGARHSAIMEGSAFDLRDTEIFNLAAYYASLPCHAAGRQDPPGAPKGAATCLACHGGSTVVRTDDPAPYIAGMSKPYQMTQLLRFRRMATGKSPPKYEDWRYHYGMTAQAAMPDVAQLEVIAGFFSRLDCNRGR